MEFDDVTGEEDEDFNVCVQITVPPDYASGGTLRLRMKKSASTGNTERVQCKATVDTAVPGASNTVDLPNSAAMSSVQCLPLYPIALTSGAALGISFAPGVSGAPKIDDFIYVYAVDWTYTAQQ
jgi:hypothetical protein